MPRLTNTIEVTLRSMPICRHEMKILDLDNLPICRHKMKIFHFMPTILDLEILRKHYKLSKKERLNLLVKYKGIEIT